MVERWSVGTHVFVEVPEADIHSCFTGRSEDAISKRP